MKDLRGLVIMVILRLVRREGRRSLIMFVVIMWMMWVNICFFFDW